MRWNIIQMMAGTDELACTSLQGHLGVSKSTVSYHIKILSQANLIDVRKDGRFYFYRLRRETVGGLIDTLMRDLIPGPALSLAQQSVPA